MELSQEANKRIKNAGRANTEYCVHIMRTQNNVIVKRPQHYGPSFQAHFASFLRDNTKLQFDSTNNWWFAPLSEARTVISTIAKDYDYILSEGIKVWLDATKPIKLFVTLEYRFKSYSKPPSKNLPHIACELKQADEPLSLTNDLQSARDELQDLGYQLVNAQVVNFYEHGVFNPLWIETFVRYDYSAEQTVR